MKTEAALFVPIHVEIQTATAVCSIQLQCQNDSRIRHWLTSGISNPAGDSRHNTLHRSQNHTVQFSGFIFQSPDQTLLRSVAAGNLQ